MSTITEVVGTIASQVRALGVKGTLVQMDERTLRVSQKKRSGYVYNTNIAYDRGRDLYDLTVYKLDMRLDSILDDDSRYGEVVAERTYSGVYVDQLAELVGKV
jgi:hypothetical protein